MTMTETIKEFFGAENVDPRSLHGLFVETLKDIYHGEKQILKALPKMARNALSEELSEAFETHRKETEGQVERLEHVFEMMGLSARGKTCEAIQGLVAEGEEVIDETDDEVRDAGLLAAAQAVEHYEMARYGTLIAWANEMGHAEVAKLLEQNLKEEKRADELLNRLAEKSINRLAAQVAGEEGSQARASSSRSGGRSAGQGARTR